MSFAVINTNQLVHHASPFVLGVALNSFSAFFPVGSSGTSVAGLVKTELKGVLRMTIRLDGPYANNEELTLELKTFHSSGDVVSLGTLTLDSDNTAKGDFDGDASFDGSLLEPGDMLIIERTYTSGGGPNNPEVGVIIQVG